MGSGINLLLFSMVPPSRSMLHCRVTKKNLIYLHDLLKRAACFPILTSPRCLFAPRDRSDCRDRSSDQSNNTFSFSEEESVNGKRLKGLCIGLFCDSRRGAGYAMKAEFTIATIALLISAWQLPCLVFQRCPRVEQTQQFPKTNNGPVRDAESQVPVSSTPHSCVAQPLRVSPQGNLKHLRRPFTAHCESRYFGQTPRAAKSRLRYQSPRRPS